MLSGLYAAVLTPRFEDGTVDLDRLEQNLRFLLARGIEGFAVNGATGEFCRTTRTEAEQIFAVAARATQDRGTFVAGIGAASQAATIELGHLAHRFGAIAALLPMPYFFPYPQDDLAATCRAVASQLSLPILLYNLPQFSSGLAPETAMQLIQNSPNIVGIKDSSGSLDCVRLLTEENADAARMIGNDGILQAALSERVCDGVISGVACVLPELLQAIYREGTEGGEDFAGLCAQLDRFIVQLGKLPTPWGLKVIAEMRGLGAATYPLSLSQARTESIASLQDWFRANRHLLLAE